MITKSNFGGAQRYVYDLATALPREMFDVAVAMGGSGVLADKLHERSIRTIAIPSLTRDVNILKDSASFRELLAIFRAERPDIVHVNSSKIGGLGALAGRITGIPRIIFTAHGWAWNEPGRSIFERTAIIATSWITVLLAHKTIAVSSAVHTEGRRLVLLYKKIVLVKNGIRPIEFLSRTAARDHLAAHTKTMLGNETFVVGTIAELNKNKGLRYAVDACATLAKANPKFRFIIIGEGEDRASLTEQILHRGASGQIFLPGFIDNAARHLKAFDCFLLPSLKEGLPYVLLEAGQAQLAVVATRTGGIPDLITHQSTGLLVSPRDALGLAQAIEALINNPAERARLANALNAKVVSKFSLEHMVEKTIALY